MKHPEHWYPDQEEPNMLQDNNTLHDTGNWGKGNRLHHRWSMVLHSPLWSQDFKCWSFLIYKVTQITWQPWDNHVGFPKATGGIQTFVSLGCRRFGLLKSLNQSSPVWRSKVCFLQHLNVFRLNLNTDGSNILVFLHQHHISRTACNPEQTRTETLRSNKQEELLNIDLAFLMILSKSGLYFYARVQTGVASLHVWWLCHIIQVVCCRWVMKS